VLYAIIGRDVARLKQLKDEGRLVLAGPFPAIDSEDPGSAGFAGSWIVAECADLGIASDWANNDPYVAAGIYNATEVTAFKKVLP